MTSAVMKSTQPGCVSFYYHRRDRGRVAEHFHGSHQISVTLGGPLSVRWWSANGGERRFVASAGNIIVNPAQEPHRGNWDDAWESAGFYIDPRVTRGIAEELGVPAPASPATTCEGRDEAAYGLARALLHDLDSDPLSCRLYAESIANLLAARLLMGHMRDRRTASGVPALAPAAMRRLDAYIGDNLERALSVSDLAAVVSLGVYHFSRRFRARTGMSPYHYVMRRRVERARQLLEEPGLPLAEIASRAGFSSQSHLTTQFRRLVGTSPGRYRGGR